MNKRFEGTIVALATPFKNGAFDEEAYRGLIDFVLSNGVEGIVPMGTTGEAVTMSAKERDQAIAVAIDAAKGRAFVIAGTGNNNTQDSVENTQRARALGADGAMIVTPYYNKPTQAGLVEHFRLIAQGNPGFPLVAYNVPGRTGVDLLPETCARLGEIPEVVAIKEATASMARAIDLVEKCGDRFSLLSGDDFTLLPFIACGGKGCISVSANVAPRQVSDLVKAARAGELAKARKLQVELNHLHRLLFIESNPIPVKWALFLMKKLGPEIRPPLTPMSEANAAKLEAELSRLGLL
ncbi:MAG: 4-hydroxy-tetrahydrodipicolinate synthase [Myxococcota bacterium]